MNTITAEARREAHLLIAPEKERIVSLLVSHMYKEQPMTAHEIAYAIMGERWREILNSVRSRLTENKHLFQVVCRKKTRFSDIRCSAYVLKNGN